MSWVGDEPKRCPTCGNALVPVGDWNRDGDFVFTPACPACTQAAEVREAYNRQPWGSVL